MDYLVRWEIEVTADSFEAAAKLAREIQLDPESTATVFDVSELDTDGDTHQIDLLELEQGEE